MSINFLYSCAFSYCASIVLLIIFFKNLSSKNKKNKNFLFMLISNLCLVAFDIFYIFMIDRFGIQNKLTEIICRLDSYFMLSTLMLFIYYIFSINTNENVIKKYNKIVIILLGIIFIVTCIISLFLGIEYTVGTTYNYFGNCVIPIYISTVIILISLIILIGKKMKIEKCQKYCYLIIIASLVLYFSFQFIFDIDLNAQSFIISLLTVSLYFNVESQDSISIINLNKLNNEYELSNKEITNIILGLSSDINNSANRIIGITNLIKNTGINKDNQNIKENIKVLNNVSSKISEYSKLKQDEITINNDIYDKNTIIEKFNKLTSIYSDKNIKFKFNIDEKFPLKINGDFNLFIDLINQIINCALDNEDFANLNINIDYSINNNELIFNINCNSNIYNKNILDNNDIYSYIINKLMSIFNSSINVDTDNKLLNYLIKFNIFE